MRGLRLSSSLGLLLLIPWMIAASEERPGAAPSERAEPGAPLASGKRIFMITDLEGVAGTERWDQSRVERPAKVASMEQLTKEVNAAVDGILEADPNARIDVWDGHGNGGIIREKLHKQATYLREGKPYLKIGEGCDALFFVGQHAMAGTPNAPLAHTYSSRSIAYYRLNGFFVGEFGCLAAMAGAHGVPVVFISGDDKAVAEAKAWIPRIFGAAVKQGRGLQRAEHLSSEEACRLIRQVAREACRRTGEIEPLKIEGPYELEIRYLKPRDFSREKRPGVEVVDERTIIFRAEKLTDLPI